MKNTAFILAAIVIAACQSSQPSQAKPPVMGPAGADRAAIVARIDGEAVTSGELDDSIRGALIRADIDHLQKVHDVRSEGLDKLVNDRLIAKKAKAAGSSSTDAFIEKEVYGTIQMPSDDEQHQLYEQAQAAGKQLPPYDEIKGEIAQFIRERKKEAALKAYTDKLRAEAKVETLLPPLLMPKVNVEAVGPSRGTENAPVTIIEFSDYECPFCGRAEPTVKEVLETYKGKVRLVFREFPLPMHDHAQKAAEAALCALDQNKYWEMHEKMFANQRSLEVPELKEYAKALAMDSTRFDKCLDGGEKAKDVAASQKAGEDAGVSGTPAFFINGRPIFGAVPIERFKEVIDAELDAATKKM
jgi:predicted DsbA family dithiol-disulfide isomerase